MKTVHAQTSSRHRDRGSKFLGLLFPANSRESAGRQVEAVRSEHPDATHHCYAWRVNPVEPEEFSQDDGEPSGSAGPPILNRLRSAEVINALLVVVRWYGGTNLGKSGLIEAYGHTAGLCLEEARLSTVTLFRRLRLRYPYGQQGLVEQLRHRYGLQELEAEYLEEVTLELGCPPQQYEALCSELQQAEHRGLAWDELGMDYG